MSRKKGLVPKPGYKRKNPYVKLSDRSRSVVVLGVCSEAGCSGRTLGSDFCRSCQAKMIIN